MNSITVGARGDVVLKLQEALAAEGYFEGTADGKFGPKTEAAVRAFQQDADLEVDGKVGALTAEVLGLSDAFEEARASTPAVRVQGDTFDGGEVKLVARLNRNPERPGMTSGTLTFNGKTYAFNTGKAKNFSTPVGTYDLRIHNMNRNGQRAFSRDGVGFTFSLDGQERDGSAVEPGSGRMWDPRADRMRDVLRLHPDGGGPGSKGCIALVADGKTLRRFRDELAAAIRANGGSVKFVVA